jgi:lipopolysaccharide transport system ATP-binding protein
VLFVSHDMQTVTRLCRRAVLLDAGELVTDGPIHEVVAAYLGKGSSGLGERTWPEGPYAPGDGVARLRSLRVLACSNQLAAAVNTTDPFAIEMVFDVMRGGLVLFPVIHLLNEWSTAVIWSTDVGAPWHGKPRPPGRYRAMVRVPGNLLAEGAMTVSASVYSLQPEVRHIHEPDAVSFQVVDKAEAPTSRGEFTGYISSVIRPQLTWTVEYEASPLESEDMASLERDSALR